MEKENCWYMALDQWGNTFHGLKHPRKDLMEKTGCRHVSKMYRDRKDGTSAHVGYVVGPHWFEVYRVYPLSK